MKHKVYYGEYTLQYWIELMISGEIELPEYQRHFVWEEDMVRNFIDSLKKYYFIPPVIIGQYIENGQTKNLILDGQQRLTSLLLSKLNIFPDKSKFVYEPHVVMDENDDTDDDDDSYTGISEWTYRKILEGHRTLESANAALKREMYKDCNYYADDRFFNEHYLGFCYLIPNTDISQQQSKYYSTLFRSINAQGVALLRQESREALYFLDNTKVSFFKPDFIESINIKSSKGLTHIDYVRFLALLSNYKQENSYNKVALGIRKDFEQFYEEYIQAVVSDEDSNRFGKFSVVFPQAEIQNRMNNLKDCIETLKLAERTYNSIINLDTDFFGLVYYVMFEGKQIDFTKKDELRARLTLKAEKFRKESKHAKSPSGLTYIRKRMKDSIDIYHKFLLL